MLLTEVAVYGDIGIGEGYLTTPDNVVVDAAGHVYITDSREYCIKKYSADGTFLGRFGSQGQGPGECIAQPFLLTLTNDSLLCTASLIEIHLFTLDGEFVRGYTLTTMTGYGSIVISSLAGLQYLYITRAAYVITASSPPGVSPPGLLRINERGKVDTAFGSMQPLGTIDGTVQFADHLVTRFSDSTLAAWNSYPYRILFYDEAGRLVRRVTRDHERFSAPAVRTHTDGSGARQSRYIAGCQMYAVLPLPDGSFLVSSVDWNSFHEGTWDIIYDLYDAGGRFLQAFLRTLETCEIRYIDQKGFAYTLSSRDDQPVIIKNRLDFVCE
ncbi:hypothetical protein JXO52_14255 [bacterium]|nr:hypothetical protein [bacterium]